MTYLLDVSALLAWLWPITNITSVSSVGRKESPLPSA